MSAHAEMADEATPVEPPVEVAAAAGPVGGSASESITVYARLKPVKDEARGDVTVPKRFGKQKTLQVCMIPRAHAALALPRDF